MTLQGPQSVAIAVIRAVVAQGSRPVIRVLEVGQLFSDEHALAVTTSPGEAAEVVRAWLEDVVARAEYTPPDNGDWR
jgi:hypothetical protein